MKVVNYTDFRQNLADNLNTVNDNREIVVVSRTKGKNVVVMDLDDFNAMQETLHLMGSAANRHRLESALEEMKRGGGKKRKLIKE
jgi:antitoxin YefM